MNLKPSRRGRKHVCAECATKYYDLGKKRFACPRCGAKPVEAKALTTEHPIKKTSRTKFGKFP